MKTKELVLPIELLAVIAAASVLVAALWNYVMPAMAGLWNF
jgi:hypothetical protein